MGEVGGAKITNMLSDLGGHITTTNGNINSTSGSNIVDNPPTITNSKIINNNNNNNGNNRSGSSSPASVSNRNVVHGHYSKVAEYMSANPAQVNFYGLLTR